MDRHRQLHLWITEYDYRLLQDAAGAQRETMSAVIRRLIKLHRTYAPGGADGYLIPPSALGEPPGPAASETRR